MNVTAEDFRLWMGTPSSLAQEVKARLAHEMQAFDLDEDDDDDDDDEDSYLLQREGHLAVINIEGGLTNRDSYWNRFFGMVSYPEIQRALVQAEGDSNIKTILLNINSPGGSPSGLDSTSGMISDIDRNSKPVYASTSSQMASAGYWLGASTRKIFGAKMADIGSIGVILTHVSYKEALEKEGIKVTVLRAGEYKALGHPAEELSDKAKKEFEEKNGQLYGFFLDHVANARGLSINAKNVWAEGRTFFAEEAKQVGLIDEVADLQDVFTNLSAEADSRFEKEENQMAKKQTVLRDQQTQAKLAAGVPMEDLEAQGLAVTQEAAAQPETETETETEGEAAAQAEGSQTEQEVAASTESVADQTGAPSEMVQFLRGELSTAQTELVSARVSLAEHAVQVETMRAEITSLQGIAVEAIHRMQIGLGGTPVPMTDLPTATVIAQYRTVKKTFDDTFKVGGQAFTNRTEEPPATVTAIAKQHGITAKQ